MGCSKYECNRAMLAILGLDDLFWADFVQLGHSFCWPATFSCSFGAGNSVICCSWMIMLMSEQFAAIFMLGKEGRLSDFLLDFSSLV